MPIFVYIIGALLISTGVFFGLWRWDAHELSLLKVKDAYHEADAGRWVAASGLRDQAIALLTSKLQTQNEAISKLQLDQAGLERINIGVEAEKSKLQADLDTRTAELEAFARASPEAVCKLSPEVRQRADGLWN